MIRNPIVFSSGYHFLNAQQMYSSFAEAPAQSFTVGSGLEELAPAQTAKAMLGALEKAVRDALAGNEVG